MNEPKPFASLTGGLLARKGAARPAMRPQLQPLRSYRDSLARVWPEEQQDLAEDDLGWNDMGHDVPAPVAIEPPVAVVVAPPAEEPVAPFRRRSALAEGRRAAFTLRVDAERHVKLRLACTLTQRSAQMLITEALDRFIAEHPEISALADRAGAGLCQGTNQQGPDQ